MQLLKKCLFFVLIFLLADTTMSFCLEKISSKSKIKFSRLYNEQIDANVLFLGNSRGLSCFYAPLFDEITGEKSFNLSHNGLTAPIINVFLEDYIARNQAPKVIFLEMSCLNDNIFVFPKFKQYMSHSNSLESLIKENNPSVYYASKISKSFSYNSEYFLRNLYFLKHNDQSHFNPRVVSDEHYDYITKDNNDLPRYLDTTFISSLENIVKQCDDNGIELIPVFAPVIDKYQDMTLISEFNNSVSASIGKEVLDLSSILSDRSMFADEVHTNNNASETITRVLHTYLQDNEIL